ERHQCLALDRRLCGHPPTPDRATQSLHDRCARCLGPVPGVVPLLPSRGPARAAHKFHGHGVGADGLLRHTPFAHGPGRSGRTPGVVHGIPGVPGPFGPPCPCRALDVADLVVRVSYGCRRLLDALPALSAWLRPEYNDLVYDMKGMG